MLPAIYLGTTSTMQSPEYIHFDNSYFARIQENNGCVIKGFRSHPDGLKVLKAVEGITLL